MEVIAGHRYQVGASQLVRRSYSAEPVTIRLEAIATSNMKLLGGGHGYQVGGNRY